jgi:hypothetical protein
MTARPYCGDELKAELDPVRSDKIQRGDEAAKAGPPATSSARITSPYRSKQYLYDVASQMYETHCPPRHGHAFRALVSEFIAASNDEARNVWQALGQGAAGSGPGRRRGGRRPAVAAFGRVGGGDTGGGERGSGGGGGGGRGGGRGGGFGRALHSSTSQLNLSRY